MIWMDFDVLSETGFWKCPNTRIICSRGPHLQDILSSISDEKIQSKVLILNHKLPVSFLLFCFSFYFHLADCIYTTLLETLRKSLCILSSAISLTNAIRFSWNQKIGNFNREAAIYYHFAWELEWKSVEWKPAERNKIYNENFSINFAPFSISGFLPFQTQL